MSLKEIIAVSYSEVNKKEKTLEILSRNLKEEEKVKVNEILTLIKKAELNIKEDKKEEALNSLNKALDKISNIVETVVEIEYSKTLKAWLLKEIAINYAKVEF
jgi:ribosomal protein S20